MKILIYVSADLMIKFTKNFYVMFYLNLAHFTGFDRFMCIVLLGTTSSSARTPRLMEFKCMV